MLAKYAGYILISDVSAFTGWIYWFALGVSPHDFQPILILSQTTAAICSYSLLYLKELCVFVPTAGLSWHVLSPPVMARDSALFVGTVSLPHPPKAKGFVRVLQVIQSSSKPAVGSTELIDWQCFCRLAQGFFPALAATVCFPSTRSLRNARQFPLNSSRVLKCKKRPTREQVRIFCREVKAWRTWGLHYKFGNKQIQSVLDIFSRLLLYVLALWAGRSFACCLPFE